MAHSYKNAHVFIFCTWARRLLHIQRRDLTIIRSRAMFSSKLLLATVLAAGTSLASAYAFNDDDNTPPAPPPQPAPAPLIQTDEQPIETQYVRTNDDGQTVMVDRFGNEWITRESNDDGWARRMPKSEK